MAKTYRIGIIGRTGKGNYGHGLDRVWADVPQAEVIAIADEHAGGRADTKRKTGAKAAYADYREMLDNEELDIVTIAPRWLDPHHDMAMAAGLATLDVMAEEKLVERAAELGPLLIDRLRHALADLAFHVDVRGKGLMIGLEIGPPAGVKLKAAYAMVEAARRGLFCQLLLIPLLKEHRLLAQVAGGDLSVIKLLPPFVIDRADIDWIAGAFRAVLQDAQSLGGIWTLGRTLAGHAVQARRA